MTVQNANVDYCDVVNLLRDLIKRGICTKAEARKSPHGSRFSTARTL